jgi:polar amino acid transport system substrate-binding protein
MLSRILLTAIASALFSLPAGCLGVSQEMGPEPMPYADDAAREEASSWSELEIVDDLATEEAAYALPDLGGRAVLIGTDPTYAPFESVDAHGEIVGIDPDLMRAICALVNCEPSFQGTSWDGIFAALRAGEFDALMSAITILPEREANSEARFTIPYYSIGQVILVRSDETEIQGVEDLAEAVVGVQNGTTGDTAASDAGVPDERLKRFDAIPLAIQALLNGDVDCVVLDSAPAAKAVATAADGALRVAGEPFTEEDYGILVPTRSPELLEAFNRAIEKLRESGEIDRIIEEWMSATEADFGL